MSFAGQGGREQSMSLDGFIAGPGHAMDWIFDFVTPDEFPEIVAATGAMLIGRRTYEVASRMEADRHVQAKVAAAAEWARIAGKPSA